MHGKMEAIDTTAHCLSVYIMLKIFLHIAAEENVTKVVLKVL